MSEAQVPVAILVRVSTVKQETQRQISELQDYASCKGMEICREIVSGRADEDSRHVLRHVQDLARRGKIKKVIRHRRRSAQCPVSHRGPVEVILLGLPCESEKINTPSPLH
jgi:predicted site-specific integrase-resolvase